MGGEEDGCGDQYTEDGTVDLKGNAILRSKRGRWAACSFIVVYEMFERVAYCGISANLIIYLTTKLHQGTVTASNHVTNWLGIVWLTPILGAYVADAHLSRYWTFLIASSIYFSGMSLLTLAVSVPGLRPPHCVASNPADCPEPTNTELTVFYAALYIVALGAGDARKETFQESSMPIPCPFHSQNSNQTSPKEKAQKLSFFNWWMFTVFFGKLFGDTILVYVQDNVGWGLGYGLPTLGLVLGIMSFLIGTPSYRHKKPTGSPFTRMARVIVAALRKREVVVPSETKELYEVHLEEYTKKGKFKIDSTPSLRFLNKACVETGSKNPWMLCSVTEVEETKQMLRMIPILITMFLPSVMVSQTHTLFVKQATTLNKNIGDHFKFPPASLGAFVTVSMLLSIIIYDRVFVKIIQKWTKNPRGITLLQRLGTGLALHILIMIIASLIEKYRLSTAKRHGLDETKGQVPLTIFILLPQFILMGMSDACFEVAKIEFFYDQAPESMKSIGTSYSMTSYGVGNFLSSAILSTVSHITKENDHKGWIQNNLNASRLDYYFMFLAILSAVNFVFFLVVARYYQYRAEVSNSMEILKEELMRT
ncbi:hypothetical protein LguiB_025954 [Lonicera macranthoides]